MVTKSEVAKECRDDIYNGAYLFAPIGAFVFTGLSALITGGAFTPAALGMGAVLGSTLGSWIGATTSSSCQALASWDELHNSQKDYTYNSPNSESNSPYSSASNNQSGQASAPSGGSDPTSGSSDPSSGNGSDLPGGKQKKGAASRGWYDNGRECVRYPNPNDQTPSKSKAEQQTSPIVLDLNGDGVTTLSRDGNKVYFDLDNNQFAERTAWASGEDGFLVRDLNGNGAIDNGGELFGNHTLLDNGEAAAHGFAALVGLDRNADGVLNAADAAWQTLRVWKDADQNGMTDQGELKTLEELGIAALSVAYQNSDLVDAAGNAHKQTGSAVLSDGSEIAMSDVWFNTQLADTRYQGDIEIGFDVAVLPNIYAFGNVLDLHPAMAKDEKLKELVQNYLFADKYTQATLLDDLIYRWTGADGIDPNSRDPRKIYGHVMDARQLVALEHLTGSGFVGKWCWGEKDTNPHGIAAPYLIAEYKKFAGYVVANLAAYAHPAFAFSWYVNQETGLKTLDYSVFNYFAEQLYAEGRYGEIADLIQIARGLATYSTSLQNAWKTNINTVATDNVTLSKLLAMNNAFIFGTDNNDTLSGNQDADFISGSAGNDTLNGNGGDDVLHGDSGDDTLNGGDIEKYSDYAGNFRVTNPISQQRQPESLSGCLNNQRYQPPCGAFTRTIFSAATNQYPPFLR